MVLALAFACGKGEDKKSPAPEPEAKEKAEAKPEAKPPEAKPPAKPPATTEVHRFENVGVEVTTPNGWKREKFFDSWKLTYSKPGVEMYLLMIAPSFKRPTSAEDAAKTCLNVKEGETKSSEALGEAHYLVRCGYPPDLIYKRPRTGIEVYIVDGKKSASCIGSHNSDAEMLETVCRSMKQL
jgi:hypothetical protein